ncbi:hypothetical protein BBJ29_005816 [Phytophthora kernoviae]|uniref:Uncharacterized protein n=1 Tax=Phytophthora kernoviae TaxID=325452 RepID=A0A3F2RPI1_9STRA|nr:hypothetical protein BBJ29_005816 [Phytophthora kernoviae]RLN61710.1 hypothetical protein BBP00_00005231 [Phytophthora kernoviae]
MPPDSVLLDDTKSQFEINLDMMEALLDVLQLYRADQHTVELSAYVLIRCQYFQELQATMKEDPSIQERFSVVKDRFDRVATMLSLKRAIE